MYQAESRQFYAYSMTMDQPALRNLIQLDHTFYALPLGDANAPIRPVLDYDGTSGGVERKRLRLDCYMFRALYRWRLGVGVGV
jgi:hypothetical protein